MTLDEALAYAESGRSACGETGRQVLWTLALEIIRLRRQISRHVEREANPFSKPTPYMSVFEAFNQSVQHSRSAPMEIEMNAIYRAIVSETKQRVKLRRFTEDVRKSILLGIQNDRGPFCPYCDHHHFLNVDCPKGKP